MCHPNGRRMNEFHNQGVTLNFCPSLCNEPELSYKLDIGPKMSPHIMPNMSPYAGNSYSFTNMNIASNIMSHLDSTVVMVNLTLKN